MKFELIESDGPSRPVQGRKRHNKPWTMKEEMELVSMRADGASYAEISKIMGRSIAALYERHKIIRGAPARKVEPKKEAQKAAPAKAPAASPHGEMRESLSWAILFALSANILLMVGIIYVGLS
jgi:hypothetical protein